MKSWEKTQWLHRMGHAVTGRNQPRSQPTRLSGKLCKPCRDQEGKIQLLLWAHRHVSWESTPPSPISKWLVGRTGWVDSNWGPKSTWMLVLLAWLCRSGAKGLSIYWEDNIMKYSKYGRFSSILSLKSNIFLIVLFHSDCFAFFSVPVWWVLLFSFGLILLYLVEWTTIVKIMRWTVVAIIVFLISCFEVLCQFHCFVFCFVLIEFILFCLVCLIFTIFKVKNKILEVWNFLPNNLKSAMHGGACL